MSNKTVIAKPEGLKQSPVIAKPEGLKQSPVIAKPEGLKQSLFVDCFAALAMTAAAASQ